MNVARLTSWLALLAPILLPAAEEDVVHFKAPGRDPFRGEITSFEEKGVILRITVELSGGRTGSSREAIPWGAIDSIEFRPLPGETAILADPGSVPVETLGDLWLEKLQHLGRPRSNAGRIGLLYAERLLEAESDISRERAMDLFRRIEREDWNTKNHPVARQGRLRALIVLGRVEDAMREAVRMAEESEDPLVLIESKYVLATADFNQLRDLEEEHPRWYLDDDVRPERNRLFHGALDQFLFACLFHGSEEEASARGLLGAAEVHRFAGDARNARLCAEDILKLYPQTTYQSKATEFLQTLPEPETASTASAP